MWVRVGVGVVSMARPISRVLPEEDEGHLQQRQQHLGAQWLWHQRDSSTGTSSAVSEADKKVIGTR